MREKPQSKELVDMIQVSRMAVKLDIFHDVCYTPYLQLQPGRIVDDLCGGYRHDCFSSHASL